MSLPPRRDDRASTISAEEVPSLCIVCDHASQPATTIAPLVIWLISDGKRGHLNQAIGLSRAIESRIPTETYTIPAPRVLRALFDWLRGRTLIGSELPNPDIVIGVGHRTHPAILSVSRARGGRSIVLMQPTLPTSAFDLVIIPEHDAPKQRQNVIVTRGVMNPIRPAGNPQPNLGLMMIGGPSRHVRWDDDSIAKQVQEVALNDQSMQWELTTSRRTPDSTIERLAMRKLPNVSMTPFAETTNDWVVQRLERCSCVWVSADSVSMVYEALTAGAAVGVFDVTQRRRNRVSMGLEQLIREDMVKSFNVWQRARVLKPPSTRINEADRCAEYIIDRWFSSRKPGSVGQ